MIRNRNDENGTEKFVITPQRRLILETIRRSCGPVDAKELYRLASKRDSTVSLATVYRSLNLFKENGLIDEHRLGKTGCCYEMAHSMEQQRMLCTSCGKIYEFESSLITDLINKLQTEKQFAIEKLEMCIQGICEECRRNKTEDSK